MHRQLVYADKNKVFVTAQHATAIIQMKQACIAAPLPEIRFTAPERLPQPVIALAQRQVHGHKTPHLALTQQDYGEHHSQ